MSNLELLSAGFSAILGTEVVTVKTEGRYSVHDLFSRTYVMRPVETGDPAETFDLKVRNLTGKIIIIRVTAGENTISHIEAAFERHEGMTLGQVRLIYDGQQLESQRTVKDYGIQPEETISAVLRLRGGGSPLCGFNTSDLHPEYDYDFTDLKDDGKTYTRGGFEYKRPYGWKRIAIKVAGRYEDDDWLGPSGIRTAEAPGEWPVSYHGTNMSSAKMILKDGYEAGPRARFGVGIYTSPSLEMVDRLSAQEFTHKGKTFKIVLQNRVNPDRRNGRLEIVPASQTGVGADYWLSPASKDDVRPYGILIREVPQPVVQSLPRLLILCPDCAQSRSQSPLAFWSAGGRQ